MDELKREIVAYWDRRAPSYTDVIEKNLEGPWEKVWADYLTARFPPGAPETMRVLDAGTGPGFYAMILAARGYRVTAVDFSAQMLAEARHNAGDLAERIDFRQMDVQALDLPEDSFDAVVTLNLTWNLQDPVKAYGEWLRVLRPGGVLLPGGRGQAGGFPAGQGKRPASGHGGSRSLSRRAENGGDLPPPPHDRPQAAPMGRRHPASAGLPLCHRRHRRGPGGVE